MLELALDDPVAGMVRFDQRDLLVAPDQLAGQVPSDLAGPAMITYTAYSSRPR
jgi:hypothetical protein